MDSGVKRRSVIWMVPEQNHALLDMHKKKETGGTVRYGVSDGSFGEKGRRGLKFTDEPTGNLDSESGKIVLEILKELVRKEGYCVVIVTHDLDIAAQADRVYVMKDGRLEERRGEKI